MKKHTWLLACFLALWASPAAAQSRVDQLGVAAALDNTDVIPLCQGCNSSTPLVGATGTQLGSFITTTAVKIAINTQTGTTYVYVDGDRGKLVTHSNGSAVAGTLPQAGASSTFVAGWFANVANLGAGTVTITPTTSTIDGAASITLLTNESIGIISDGANYFTVRGRVPLFLQSATQGGNTTKIATVSGSLGSGNCLKADANGNIADNGGACASGGVFALPSNAQTGGYTTIASDNGKCIASTTSGADATITLLSAATAGDGAMQCVYKANSDAFKTIVSGGPGAWLSAQWDFVTFRSDGTAWNAYAITIAPRLDTFTANGTFTQPPLAARNDIRVVGSGGTGGSGSSGDNTSARGGGGGGGAGCVASRSMRASDVAAASGTVAVTVGGQTAVAAGVTGAGTTGTAGGSGAASTFGAFAVAHGGGGGAAGSAAGSAANGGAAGCGSSQTYGATTAQIPGSAGNGSGTTTGSVGNKGSAPEVYGGAGAGGGGAGKTTTPATAAGGVAGAGHNTSNLGMFQQSSTNQGGAGAGGTAGNACASTSSDMAYPWFGDGGSGGGSNSGAVGGAGCNGAAPGGGGGGGGSTDNTSTSGAGGRGARGEVNVLTSFVPL